MRLPDHKTKIIATMGPASSTPEMLERREGSFESQPEIVEMPV